MERSGRRNRESGIEGQVQYEEMQRGCERKNRRRGEEGKVCRREILE